MIFIALLLWDRTLNIWSPSFWFAFGITISLLIRGLILYQNNYQSPLLMGSITYGYETVLNSQIVILIGTLSYLVGYVVFNKNYMRVPNVVLKEKQWKYLRNIAWVSIFVGIFGAYWVFHNSIFSLLFNTFQERQNLQSQGIGVLNTFLIAMTPAIIILLQTSKGKYAIKEHLVLIVISAVYLMTGSRSLDVALALYYVMYTWHNKKGKSRTISMVIIVVLCFLLILVIPLYRYATATVATSGSLSNAFSIQVQNGLLNSIFENTFNSFDGLLMVLSIFPGQFNPTYGSQTLLLPFETLIPRQIWPSKPVPMTNVIAQQILGWGSSGNFVSIFGQFYIEGLFLGVIVGMFIFGILCKWTVNYYKHLKCVEDPLLVIKYAPLLYSIIRFTVAAGSLDIVIFYQYIVSTFILTIPILKLQNKQIVRLKSESIS